MITKCDFSLVKVWPMQCRNVAAFLHLSYINNMMIVMSGDLLLVIFVCLALD